MCKTANIRSYIPRQSDRGRVLFRGTSQHSTVPRPTRVVIGESYHDWGEEVVRGRIQKFPAWTPLKLQLDLRRRAGVDVVQSSAVKVDRRDTIKRAHCD